MHDLLKALFPAWGGASKTEIGAAVVIGAVLLWIGLTTVSGL
jgi:hypothetical protein